MTENVWEQNVTRFFYFELTAISWTRRSCFPFIKNLDRSSNFAYSFSSVTLSIIDRDWLLHTGPILLQGIRRTGDDHVHWIEITWSSLLRKQSDGKPQLTQALWHVWITCHENFVTEAACTKCRVVVVHRSDERNLRIRQCVATNCILLVSLLEAYQTGSIKEKGANMENQATPSLFHFSRANVMNIIYTLSYKNLFL